MRTYRQAALFALVLVSVSGCLGQVGDLPTDFVNYKFDATVLVNPTQPVPGQAVNLNVELTSHSNTVLLTDVVLQVVRRSDSVVVYEQAFGGVKFHPEEVWNLTQGFLLATDAGGPLDVVVVIHDHDSGEKVWTGTPGPLD